MCLPGQSPPAPATAAEAAAMARAALGWLAAADPASWTTAEQAGCLRALEQARVGVHRGPVPGVGRLPLPGRVRRRRPRLGPDLAEVAVRHEVACDEWYSSKEDRLMTVT